MNHKRDTGLANDERTEMLLEAQEKLQEAIDLIEQAVRGTPHEDYVDAYVASHLKIMASRDHGYLSRDTNLDDLIGYFDGSGEPDEEEHEHAS